MVVAGTAEITEETWELMPLEPGNQARPEHLTLSILFLKVVHATLKIKSFNKRYECIRNFFHIREINQFSPIYKIY